MDQPALDCLSSTRLSHCEYPVLIGDDITDEAVFDVFDFAGYAYSAIRPIAGARETWHSPRAARLWLASLTAQPEATR